MTTSPVVSVTDDLVAELEQYSGVPSIAALLAERAELKRDAERFRWLIRQAWFQSAMDRYDIDDGGLQVRFESEAARIIDAAMQS